MELKLYNKNAMAADIIERGTDENGEISEEALAELQALEIAAEEKTAAIVCILKQWRAEIKTIDETAEAEAARYAAMIKQRESNYKRLATYLFNCIGGNVKTIAGNVSFRKTQTTEIARENVDNFTAWAKENGRTELYTETVKTTVTPNKTAIKEAINNGEEIPFCSVRENLSATVK